MELRFLDSLEEIPATTWNALAGIDHPFTRHEFLAALERHGCAGPEFGWRPHHAVLHHDGEALAAAPFYLKSNSYGELVFDHAWADAYRRHGLAYYPKLVNAVPYTPATGPRLLLAAGADRSVAEALVGGIIEECERHGLSGAHWLFPRPEAMALFTGAGLMPRLGCQFHWNNPGYRDFKDFLDTFSAAKRKKVNRERRRVREQRVELEVVRGDRADESQWAQMDAFYRRTFDDKYGVPTLNLGFFLEVAERMGGQALLVFARHEGRTVAGALNFMSGDTLYGRHWGTTGDYHSLHFEVCYYQGIEYCIREGLRSFEPGAQGEYKVSRGFVPTATWSAHWIRDPAFRAAIERHTRQEQAYVEAYMAEMNVSAPYKNTI